MHSGINKQSWKTKHNFASHVIETACLCIIERWHLFAHKQLPCVDKIIADRYRDFATLFRQKAHYGVMWHRGMSLWCHLMKGW